MKGFGIQLIDNTDDGEIMDLKIIPKRDAEGKIIEGIVLGDTLEQNKALILLSGLNDFKMNPDLGVNIADITLSSDLLEYRHKIRSHFEKDGLKVKSLELYSLNNIKIEADYE